jgi:hypothetical protein
MDRLTAFSIGVGLCSSICSLAVEPEVASPKKTDPVLGKWRYFNDHIVTVTPDGRLTSSKAVARGTWEFAKNKEVERKYRFIWQEGLYVDSLLLSRDGKKLAGKNQKGDRVSAERIAP